jgi:hypothetical protein
MEYKKIVPKLCCAIFMVMIVESFFSLFILRKQFPHGKHQGGEFFDFF